MDESCSAATVVVVHEDIDKNDFSDPQAVAEYVNHIYEYLMIKEVMGLSGFWRGNIVNLYIERPSGLYLYD